MSLEYPITLSSHSHLVFLLLLSTLVHHKLALVITNRMRYSQPRRYHDLESVTSYSTYKLSPQNNVDLNKFKTLDEEDKRLLDRFYQSQNLEIPAISNQLSIEHAWRSKYPENSLKPNMNDGFKHMSENDLSEVNSKSIENPNDNGWQIDSKELEVNSQTPNGSQYDVQQARYSPLIKILTSYDPLGGGKDITTDTPNTNKIVGETLGLGISDAEPLKNSTLAIDAIKLHDDMLKPAPRDGKVRVRMYYHQAIHDDVRLYGNGPWKYWGHGWGMELGYHPKNATKNFYQKGYNIERAYGRDFCKDKTKCRKSDPTFFDNMLDAGKYTKNKANEIRA